MRAALASVLVLLVVGCASSDEPPPDPPGTVLVTMRLGDRLCFDCPTTGTDLVLDNAGNLTGQIAPLGALAGLGAITKTVAVSQRATTAVAGEGYVVKGNNAFDSYYAIYVDDYLESPTGGELGVYLKWAPLSAVSSLTIAPNPVTVTIPQIGMAETPPIAVTLTYSDGRTVDAHRSALYTVPVCGSAPCPTMIDDPSDATRLIVQIKAGMTPGTLRYTFQASPYAAAKATLSVTAQ